MTDAEVAVGMFSRLQRRHFNPHTTVEQYSDALLLYKGLLHLANAAVEIEKKLDAIAARV